MYGSVGLNRAFKYSQKWNKLGRILQIRTPAQPIVFLTVQPHAVKVGKRRPQQILRGRKLNKNQLMTKSQRAGQTTPLPPLPPKRGAPPFAPRPASGGVTTCYHKSDRGAPAPLRYYGLGKLCKRVFRAVLLYNYLTIVCLFFILNLNFIDKCTEWQ